MRPLNDVIALGIGVGIGASGANGDGGMVFIGGIVAVLFIVARAMEEGL